MSNPFRYVGKYGVQTDGDDLLFMRARYYKPSIGRFINKDPIGLAGGMNLYNYVGGNPIGRIDPAGLFEQDVFTRCVSRVFSDAYIDVVIRTTLWSLLCAAVCCKTNVVAIECWR
ncbi:MAG: RHS repeat-associated core domain-containing protein [Candidatus Omnitrophica bacterium]|nr:RHS repeat-associated core domain-containing protein [Candidatus Omnitrophota bacterium]